MHKTIVINAVGLSPGLLSAQDTPIAMLSNGCICCQAGSDLAYTIDRLLAIERPGACGPLHALSKPKPESPQRAPMFGRSACALLTRRAKSPKCSRHERLWPRRN